MRLRLLVATLLVLASAQAGRAAVLPEGFTERQIASGLTGATAMALAPDGRLFVCRQNGQLRVIKNGALLPTPFLTLSVDATGERGLLGVAFDPDFANNGFVYVYHTVSASPRHNRVSRFTADGDVAAANSEALIFRLDDLGGAALHNGGAMHFGPDGKLYVAVGDNARGENAQTLDSLFGKMLRINPDGSIPSDNPFFNTASGNRRAVWAMGLRNPFTFAFQPGTPRLFINDVGEKNWEEVNDGVAGANYGWPATEGPTINPSFRAPVFAYGHGEGGGCAITGGAFYNAPVTQFPSTYVGKYFFADFCSGWIRTLDPADGSTSGFASGVRLPVDLKVGPEGSLYYLARVGAVFQISFAGGPTNNSPIGTIETPAQHSLYGGGETISYSGTAHDDIDGELTPSAFTWRVDFHSDTKTRTLLPPTTGSRSGSFFIPADGDKSANLWYRIHLRVTDSAGLTHESFRDVLPRRVRVTLATEPAGLQLSLDGVPMLAPASFVGVAGIERNAATVHTQGLDGVTYQFQGWSDGGAIEHDFATPATEATLTAVFAPAASSAPGFVQFGAASYDTSEADGHVSVSVTRGGDASELLNVEYATFDGTATERSDYLPALGSLRFDPGETSKVIRVLLTGGSVVEGIETFSISLTHVGAPFALGSPSVATVSVEDDDTTLSSDNPIDEAGFFVQQQYQDFLNREADADGLGFWSNEILSCGADAQCIAIKRDNVSAAFFLSIEFQETGFLVYRLNVASFARFPRFREFLRDTQAMGRGVVVGQGDWQQRLEENQHAFIGEFIARPEFIAEYPPGLAPSEFVDRLNTNTEGSLSQAERDALVGGLTTGALDRAAVLREVTRDDDFVRRETNRAFVLLQYFGYLRRNPDDQPNDDLSGYEFWLSKLDQFDGDFRRAEMVRAFISSIEYRQRFGP
ncbi:MAG: PQQ-dependent sugar dehydrogenase [Rubrivivax sp.]|nr:PQQ-dependent sugar dehydrogenase [Pyrinomonadaceae bacterium]